MKSPPALLFEPSGFFVLRSPLLPLETLERWGADLVAVRAEPEVLADALASDRSTLVARLREELCKPVVREALFCASPSLDEAVERWLVDPADPRSKGVTEAVVRYFSRMSARATPFGLFAGCSLGGIGDTTRLHLAPQPESRRHSRLDMHYVMALVQALEQDPVVRSALRYVPSSGLGRIGGQIRYAEALTDAKTRERSYRLTSVDATSALDLVLARAAAGATLSELEQALVQDDPELAHDEAADFVREIVDSQILVSELVPPITGEEPIHHVIRVLRERTPGHDAAVVLERTRDALDALDRKPLGVSPTRYREIAQDLVPLPTPVELSRLLQIDMVKPAPEARLGGLVLREIERGVELLWRLSTAREPDELTRFRQAFTERYEQREVRLCEVLDEETGIGFAGLGAEPTPLFDGLVFPPPAPPPGGPPDGKTACLLRGLTGSLRAGRREWVLEEHDLTALEQSPRASLSDGFAVMCTVVAGSDSAVERRDFRVAIMAAVGPSGANLLGRFCQADPALSAAVARHLRAEEALTPGATLAEIVHLPEGREGNVLCRPVLRDVEIPYLGRSGVDPSRQLPIGDLFVAVRGGRVVLWSEKLNREIVPRLTNAHNFRRSCLGTYRFLCALQGQMSLSWDWGPFAGAPFLPRVSHGRLVLSPASWHVGERELLGLGKAGSVEGFRSVQALRRDLQLPRWIWWVEGDNRLPVDLDNVLSIDAFIGVARQRKSAVIQEMFPAPGEVLAQGPEGRYMTELVVPFLGKREPTRGPELLPRPSTRRSFPPGSEWLYVKLYAGTSTAERLLIDVVAPLVRGAIDSGRVDRWFFIRYGDPHWHLRVRLHGDPALLTGRVLSDLRDAIEPYVVRGSVRMALDTYEREIERYGGDRGIELAESIFHADSDAALRVVAACDAEASADARWHLVLLGMHRLFSDFGIELPERVAILAAAHAQMSVEHAVDVTFQRQLDAKFRHERPALEELLFGAIDATGAIGVGAAALDARSHEVARLADELSRIQIADVAWSHVHMHANRVLVAEHRKQELVLYHFLHGLYRSQLARARVSAARELI